ncbi:MAG: glycosyltransferase family 2 protein [Deltaproteobacteria bacterium]|nr:glycosyltransferase family 2 protein [Deltaproteobacteria bacterium]
MKKAILIPVFNEEVSIKVVIDSLLKLRDRYDIIVVDDGSYDKTPDILKDYDIVVLRHCINSGYGAAIQTGLRYLYDKGYEQAILFDGDGQHPVESIDVISLEQIKQKKDIVIGSRFLSGYEDVGTLKRIALKFFSLIIYIVTKVTIKDPTSGFKCLNRRAMRYYISDVTPLSFPDADAMILAIKSGLTIIEIPVRMNKRISGRSMHYGLRAVMYMMNMFFSLILCVLKSDDELKMEE